MPNPTDTPAPTLTNRLRPLLGQQGGLRRHLARAAGGSAVLALSSKLLMLMTTVVLARRMGAESYGVYATAMAMVALLSVPTALGLPTLTVRLVASYRAQGQWALMRGFLVRSNQVVFLLSVFIATIAAFVLTSVGSHFDPTEPSANLLALALIPLMGLSALRSAALRGLHHVVLGQLSDSLIMPGVFLALIFVWSTASGDAEALSPETAITARIIAVVAAYLIGAWILLHRLPTSLRAVTSRYEVKQWARSAAPLLFMGGMSVINTQTDVLMLAAIKGNEAAGVYQAAARGADLVAFSLMVINMAIQPSISRLYATGQSSRLQRLITAAARGALAFALPVALALIVLGKPILSLIFGNEFERGATALGILCCGQIINAAAGSVGQILNMTGHERDSAFGFTIGAATNFVLNLLLIPIWGLEGAALATTISLCVWNIILARLVRKRTGLSSTALGI